jgi:hypothetical protein
MSDLGSELEGTTNPPDAREGVILPGVYDGVAYWVMPDGSRVNRWPLDTRRGQRIQRIIDGKEPGYPYAPSHPQPTV